MGFPFDLALRYMASKKQSFISMGTFFAVLGVALGVAGLATAMSVTGGFRKEFRDKVLGVNAHVLVLKRSSYFGEYRELMKEMKDVPGVTGVAPFTINPMMVTRGDRTATGVLLKGVDPARVKDVLDLPKHMTEGNLDGLRLPGAKPPTSRRDSSPTMLGSDLVITGDLPDDASKKDAPKNEALGDDTQKKLDKAAAAEPSDDDTAPDDSAADADAVDAALDDAALDAEEDPFDRIPGDLLDTLGAARDDEESESETAPDGTLKLEEGAPMGSIVPEGGYGSELPDDDFLPEDINDDPCAKGSAALPGIVIGKTLGENLRAGIGDCVQVTSPTIGFSFSRDSIRAPVAKQFRVTGIFYAGFDQYDAKLVYTDLYEAQQFADAGDSVTGLEMRVSDIDDARNVARIIDKRLENGLHYTMDWEELNHGLFTALRIQQILMSAVLALIIVVAAFTVIATLIMVVLDKKKEIAVLKAMGAADSAILRSFLYQGMIIGAVGGVVGLVMAVIVCKLLIVYAIPLDPKVYFISHLPVDMQPTDLALVGVFAVVVCLLATAWPALHAARLRPAEAFREQ